MAGDDQRCWTHSTFSLLTVRKSFLARLRSALVNGPRRQRSRLARQFVTSLSLDRLSFLLCPACPVTYAPNKRLASPPLPSPRLASPGDPYRKRQRQCSRASYDPSLSPTLRENGNTALFPSGYFVIAPVSLRNEATHFVSIFPPALRNYLKKERKVIGLQFSRDVLFFCSERGRGTGTLC